eukprot:TRINITY_DN7905_c0_g1_i1.p1 TRINITY_DN7905_c0_g1~~TRINITY_DN7905_c0_g1_i1.p1  ORF type:complete len:687 (+),score=141.88 TRINITY_DN7905_c0_g1_i1:466-2526(+)
MDELGCDDIDECLDPPLGCIKCFNTPGSYYCTDGCDLGYVLVNGICVDKTDECALHLDNCEQVCVNLPNTIVDQNNQTVSSTPFRCDCHPGYRLNSSTTCEFYDYCGFQYDNCTFNCSNIEGGYQCTCPTGYKINTTDYSSCLVSDECYLGLDNCADLCIDTDDGFVCGCSAAGYSLNADNITCYVSDECLAKTDNCQQVCTHIGTGGYNCSCNEGYSLNSDESTCSISNECMFDLDNCEQICIDKEVGFECACNSSYVVNPANSSTCLACNNCVNGFCVLRNGFPSCSCQPGWKGKSCDVVSDSSQLSDLVALGYNHQLDAGCLPSEITVWFKTNPDGLIDFAVRGAGVTGYVAIAFTSGQYQMIGSEAVVGYVSGDGSYTITAYDLYSKDVLQITESHHLSIQNLGAEEVAGTTTIFFSRSNSTGRYPFTSLGEATIIASWGKDDGFGQHTKRSDGACFVNSITGESRVIEGPAKLKSTHGILMIVSWGIILPLGMFISRYGRKLDQRIMGYSMWVMLHPVFQFTGYCLALAAFIIALTMVGDAHFSTPWHGQLGILIMVMGTLQVMVAGMRPPKDSIGDKGIPFIKHNPKLRKLFEYFHWWNGRIVLVIAVIQIFEGLRIINWTNGVAGWAAYVALGLCAIITLEVYAWIKKSPHVVPCFECLYDYRELKPEEEYEMNSKMSQ